MDEDKTPVEEELVLRVVNAGRRQRLRRFALLATTLLVAGGLAAGAIAIFAGAPRGPGATADGKDTPRVPPPGTTQVVSDRAQIYAAALEHAGMSRETRHPLLVRTHICTTVAQAPAGQECDDGIIPPDVQQAVVTSLGDAVRFADDPPFPRDPGDSTIVVFGELVLTGDQAELGMEYGCGPLCGQGSTLLLDRSDGAWTVTGASGSGWIS